MESLISGPEGVKNAGPLCASFLGCDYVTYFLLPAGFSSDISGLRTRKAVTGPHTYYWVAVKELKLSYHDAYIEYVMCLPI